MYTEKRELPIDEMKNARGTNRVNIFVPRPPSLSGYLPLVRFRYFHMAITPDTRIERQNIYVDEKVQMYCERILNIFRDQDESLDSH